MRSRLVAAIVFIIGIGALASASNPAPEYTAWKRHFKRVDTPFGKKTALLDKRTHLEWLQLNLTANHSYEQVLKQQSKGGKFASWRLATVEELRTFFAHFTASPNGRCADPAIERKLQRLLGGPLDVSSNPANGWARSSTTGWVGDPVGPDNNMIHYHHGYIAEDSGPPEIMVHFYKMPQTSGPAVTIDPDYGGSSIPGFASPSQGSFLVRKHKRHWPWRTLRRWFSAGLPRQVGQKVMSAYRY